MKRFFITLLLCFLMQWLRAQTSYCGVSFPGGVAPITYVQFGSLSNVSAAVSTTAHENFTGVVDTVYGGILELVIRGNTGGNFTDTLVAYFDWNADGDFTDPGETYPAGKLTNSSGTTATESAVSLIACPIFAPAAQLVRMRIVKKRTTPGASCNNAGVGQAEDYSVYVLGNVLCAGTPLAGTASISASYTCNNIPFILTTTSYTHSIGNYWQWESSPKGKGIWTAIPGATTPTYVMPGISQSSDYRLLAGCINAGGFDLSNTVSAYNAYANFSHNTPLCVGDTLQVSLATCSSCTVNITGPGGFLGGQIFAIPNVQLANEGWYRYSVTDNGCSVTTAADSFFVDVSNCQDSVWPGDVNLDKITNHLDLLSLALNFGSYGVPRPNASLNYVGQACPDWAFSFQNVNQKHADCDGDGYVSFADTVAIAQNYSLVHPRGNNAPKNKVSADPNLYFDVAGVKFFGNDSVVRIPVMLGTAATPVSGIYGIAAEIKIVGIQPQVSLRIIHTGSWLNEQLRLTHNTGQTQVSFAYARIGGANTFGFGKLFDLELQVPAAAIGDSITLYFDELLALNANGDTVNLLSLSAQVQVESPLGIAQVAAVGDAAIVPNPSTGKARLVLPNDLEHTIRITTVAGHVLWEESGKGVLQLPDAIPSGIYFISILHPEQQSRVLKWVKQ